MTATYSPWDVSSLPADVSSSGEDYTLTRSGGSNSSRIVLSQVSRSAGKYAIRLLVSRTGDHAPAVGFSSGPTGTYLGDTAVGWGLWGDEKFSAGAAEEILYNDNPTHGSSYSLGDLASFATPQEVMIEIDITEGKAWFGVNGVWGEGDPETGEDPIYTNVSGAVQIAADMYYGGNVTLLQPGEFSTPASDGFAPGWPDHGPVSAYASSPSPLADPSLLVAQKNEALSSAPSPLQSPAVLVDVLIGAIATAPSPLGEPRARMINDWTNTIPPTAQIYYRAELRHAGGTVKLPISSWQATIQIDRASFLQAVVPAAETYIDDIIEAGLDSELAIVRGVRVGDEDRELDMASVPLGQMPYQSGPQRSTVTLSGYGAIAFEAVDGEAPPSGTVRSLTEVQTISTQGGTRVRAGIDWLLRPGLIAEADGVQFNVSYINYYVNAANAFMDVGERPQ